ncbi:tRNA (adenosine(37)-N6)-dimethylallyltransferase MiaA [Sphingobacterium sp. SYP-B4668]|uniref:tRNA (adenosine(37)-N6)-dimethylallyltransferase MiaA n=1 Tax=Sphingobacterium sp. SYP-B4668 TaxID=2996035 RepID=UPI0022DD93BB|nr:tRNA (adenosine(37)-N6)-dimethylallyltransferase MiaA [Sphingobacterium sp. SYP-B4668]
MKQKTLIAIVGPTAIGKTAMAIQVANHFKTEIISADSRQFYREMTIGTAKPSMEELAAAPHHFVDSHSIEQDYSAGDFERDVLALLEKLFQIHDVVVLVGGSGLFVKAVCEGLDNLPKPLPGVRDRLNNRFEAEGIEVLQTYLREVDPEYFEEVDRSNSQRVIRALEVYESTGKPFSFYRQNTTAKRPFNIITIALNTDREKLYDRINRRVDTMVAAGLIDEVKSLVNYKDKPALLTVGYAEIFDYLACILTWDEAIDRIKQNSRRYAKRQITWFKKGGDAVWFEPQDIEQVLDYIQKKLKA